MAVPQHLKVCPDCLSRYPTDQVRCATAQHGRLLELSDADDPRVGALIDGRYLLLGRLGEGAMGVVYRAWQRSTAREVALKILPVEPELRARDALAYAEARARFRREVQLAARIDSAFVARVHDSGELPDGGLYFVMEKVAGTTLEKILLTEGRLPAARVIQLGQQLGQALGVVHALGLVHRDVKPANLMVVSSPQGGEHLKLVDFGIARAFEVDVQMGKAALTQLTMAGTLIGSFAYMAPEQLSSPGSPGALVGPWTDVYAAGCTLYELATGALPFPGPTAPAFAYQHRTAPIPSLSSALGADSDRALLALEQVVTRALAKLPAERYPDGAALASALHNAASAAGQRQPDQNERRYGPDDTVPEGLPAGAAEGALDPGALRGISVEDVRARVASGTIEVAQRPRFTKGRVAFALATTLGIVTVLWDLVGTLPR